MNHVNWIKENSNNELNQSSQSLTLDYETVGIDTSVICLIKTKKGDTRYFTSILDGKVLGVNILYPNAEKYQSVDSSDIKNLLEILSTKNKFFKSMINLSTSENK
jgi:hypothetical protein